MKQIIRTVIIFLIGLITASIAAYVYFNITGSEKEVRQLEPVSLTGEEEAFITAISGEVYILRDESILSAEIGEALYAGDIIKVVDDSFCQVQFSDVAAARIRSNTIIKIKNLFNLDKSIDIKTEILTGSMLYRVNKLSEGEKLEVKSEDRIFSVRGTTFLVDRNSEGTHLIVDEGLIAVSVLNGLEESMSTSTGEELFIETGSEEENLSDISAINRQIMKESEILNILTIEPESDKLIKTGVVTVPGDAQIYVNGILSGKGTYTGLFPKEEELIFLVRKRGYEDKVLSVKAVTDLEYTIYLDPEGTDDEILNIERTRNTEDSNLNKLRRELASRNERLQEVEELIIVLKERNSQLESDSSTFENRIRKMTGQIQVLEQQREDLTTEITELERKLGESTAREDKLRELIKQIQDISASDN
jgi:FecR protein